MNPADQDAEAPGPDAVRALQAELQEWLIRTPVVRCRGLEDRLGMSATVFGKLEFLQRTGTFKPRGALSTMLRLDTSVLANGVTAVSAGNHAIATAFAARALGVTAKVVMIPSANPLRVSACRDLGAEIVVADDVHHAFELADEICASEGRYFVHPFEGPAVAAGTATIGMEILEQVDEFDAVVVPIGGGGLCAGIASAIKQAQPDCEVVGVEPTGADSMRRSFSSGAPERLAQVSTIADSLGAPFAMPYSFSLCRRYVDDIVLVEDEAIRQAMAWLFVDMKIAVEPACAATTAALAGALRTRFDGKRVVLVFCGSNIDRESFHRFAGPYL